ncbi:hypothetical protein, partial [Venenivibrio stagnispumantis]
MKKISLPLLTSVIIITNAFAFNPFKMNVDLDESKVHSSLDKAYEILSDYKECVLNKNANACYETGKNVDNIVLKSILVKTACKLGDNQACEEQNKLKEQTKNSCSNSIYDDNCRAFVYLSDGNVDTSNWEKYNLVIKEKTIGFDERKITIYTGPDKTLQLSGKACLHDYARGFENLFDMFKKDKELTEQEKKECKIGIRYYTHIEENLKYLRGALNSPNSRYATAVETTIEKIYHQTKEPYLMLLMEKI